MNVNIIRKEQRETERDKKNDESVVKIPVNVSFLNDQILTKSLKTQKFNKKKIVNFSPPQV